MKRLKEYYVTIILIAAVIVINVAAFALYIVNVNKDIEKQTQEHLTQLMVDSSTCVQLRIEETLNELEMTAFYIGMAQDYEDAQLMNSVAKMSKKAGFSEFDILNKDGIGLIEKGQKDYSETKLLKKASSGDIYITDFSNNSGEVVGIRIGIPIMNEQKEFSGVYLAECDLDAFHSLLNLDSVSKLGKAFVIRQDGVILNRTTDSSVKNVNDILNDESQVKKLKSYMKSKKSGVISFENGENTKRYICYSKTDFNNWKVIMVASSGNVEANIHDITDNFVFLGVVIATMLVLLIAYFIYLLCNVQSKSTMNLRRYYMVSKYSDDIILDYSCSKDSIYSNENWEKLFGYKLKKENFKDTIREILPEGELAEYQKHIDDLRQTADDIVQFKTRIYNSEKEEIICFVKLFAVKNIRKKVIKIVGVVEKMVK